MEFRRKFLGLVERCNRDVDFVRLVIEASGDWRSAKRAEQPFGEVGEFDGAEMHLTLVEFESTATQRGVRHGRGAG